MTHYHASNKVEAWRLANALFPTDYEYDVKSTERAGYPIYTSTADCDNSHISDLEVRLELNIWHGQEIETITIWIDYEEEKETDTDTITREAIKDFVKAAEERYNRCTIRNDAVLTKLAEDVMAYRRMAEALLGEELTW